MPNEFTIQWKHGGGVHSRASIEEIDPRECTTGQNFDLDFQNRNFKNRKPFDLIGTVPNAQEIRGFANLQKSDGTVSVLVQAGTNVYEWDGVTTFTLKGTVASGTKLRGRLEHNWQLSDKVIITDLNLTQPVMEWDGTTLQNITFTADDGSTAFGTFKARYCTVSNERAIFSNIHDNGTDTPHLIVGSQRGDFTIISVANRPASALNEADPFFLIQPDYRYINGMVESFGVLATSSRSGSMFKLTGSSAKDFAFEPLHPRSGASGDESVATTGNDITYGRNGRIESLLSTDRFGDVETDDISQDIYDQIETFNNWTVVYNARNQRVYCVPVGESEIWVMHKSLMGGELSPWSQWVTNHSMSFQPTCIMNMLDPADGLEYVFFGDSNGNFYRLEGTGALGDGGLNNITVIRKSKLFSAPLDAEIYDVEGWIKYEKNETATVTLDFEFGGMSVFTEQIVISVPSITGGTYYGGGAYYSGGVYYGSFRTRITRQKFAVPGKGNEFQIKATIEGTKDFTINEIGLKFKAV